VEQARVSKHPKLPCSVHIAGPGGAGRGETGSLVFDLLPSHILQLSLFFALSWNHGLWHQLVLQLEVEDATSWWAHSAPCRSLVAAHQNITINRH
jgi:hypothetical protein